MRALVSHMHYIRSFPSQSRWIRSLSWELPINILPCFWEVGGNSRTQRKPTCLRIEPRDGYTTHCTTVPAQSKLIPSQHFSIRYDNSLLFFLNLFKMTPAHEFKQNCNLSVFTVLCKSLEHI